MDKKIWINANINVISHSAPIRFAHHKSIDKPDNHVLHLNNYVEIYVYVSGDHHYIVENSLYKLNRGDIIIINPREVHKAMPLSECPYERFYFLLDERAFDVLELDPLKQILNRPKKFGNLVSMGEAREDFLAMMYEISDCFKKGHDDQLKAFGFLVRILGEIDRRISQGSSHNGDITATPQLLRNILAYVAEHTAEIQSTSEISSALGVSPQYLSSYFSKHIGTPLKTFIQAKKIALSKEMLENGADVTQACYDCGFNDCSYFIRVFKKYVGVTPMAYKKKQNT